MPLLLSFICVRFAFSWSLSPVIIKWDLIRKCLSMSPKVPSGLTTLHFVLCIYIYIYIFLTTIEKVFFSPNIIDICTNACGWSPYLISVRVFELSASPKGHQTLSCSENNFGFTVFAVWINSARSPTVIDALPITNYCASYMLQFTCDCTHTHTLTTRTLVHTEMKACYKTVMF